MSIIRAEERDLSYYNFDDHEFYEEEPFEYSYDISDIQEEHFASTHEALWEVEEIKDYYKIQNHNNRGRYRGGSEGYHGLFCDTRTLARSSHREPTPNKLASHREKYSLAPAYYQSYEYE